MVATKQQKQKKGNVLDLLGLREIRDGVLCLRPTTSKKRQQEREYRGVLAVDPINFSLMEENEQEIILEGFRVFLQRLHVHQNISVHIQIRPYDIRPYLEKLEEAQNNPSPLIREIASDHEDFVLALASQQAILQRRFYVRIALPVQQGKTKKRLTSEERFDQAKTQLNIISQGLLEDLRRASLTGHRLEDDELAQYYLSCIHSQFSQDYPLNPANFQAIDRPLHPVKLQNALKGDLSFAPLSVETSTTGLALTTSEDKYNSIGTQEEIHANSSQETKKWSFSPSKKHGKGESHVAELAYHVKLAELVAPSMIYESKHYIQIYRETAEYFRGRCIVGYPSYVVAGWLDRLVQIDEPDIDIVLYLSTLEPTKYIHKLTRQITSYRATQAIEEKHGKVENPHIKIACEEAEVLRDQLVQQTERMHTVSLYLCIRASSESELEQRDEKMVELLRSLDLESVELSLEHLQAWLCVLPDSNDVLNRRKLLETSSVVTAFPFSSASISTEPGALYGVMPAGNLVIMNPTSETLENGHEIKFARSGAGKSYHEKVWLMRLLCLGYEATIIDPEDEYATLCKKFGGTNIRLASGRLQLNPFDLPLIADTDRSPLEEKFQSLLVLCDLLLADSVLPQREKAFLNRCFTKVYEDKGITRDLSTHQKDPPCMRDLYTAIGSGECGQDIFNLGDRLLRHLEAFPITTNVDMDNKLIVFNIRDLADDLKPVGLFLAADFVWTQARRKHHPQPRILTIDEAWFLLQFPEGGRFLSNMSRRARKYNLILRIISQNVEDFLSSEEGRTLIANSATKFLMKQDTTTIEMVVKAFHLSDGERKFLLTCNYGEGLLYANLSHVPLKVIASKAEHKIATTNAQELIREEIEALRQQQEELNAEAIALKQSQHEYSIVFPRFYRPESETEETR